MKRLLLCLVVLPIFLVGSCSNTTTAQREPLPSSSTATPTHVDVTKPIWPKPFTPQMIHILGRTALITPVSLNGNELIPPSDPHILGWWGKKPGVRHGATLLVGHTVHTGGGFLDDLETVPVGDILVVGGSYHQMKYKVVSNDIISKEQLAKQAPNLFSQTGPPWLVVVTCEDYNWSTGEYASNVVLIAKLTR